MRRQQAVEAEQAAASAQAAGAAAASVEVAVAEAEAEAARMLAFPIGSSEQPAETASCFDKILQAEAQAMRNAEAAAAFHEGVFQHVGVDGNPVTPLEKLWYVVLLLTILGFSRKTQHFYFLLKTSRAQHALLFNI